MYFAFDGKSLISPTVFFRFAARTSGGICANQSESRKVLFSVKSGSLNTSRNSHPWSRLNGVREPRLEVPQVTGQNVVNEVPTLLVDAGNPASPVSIRPHSASLCQC